MARTFGGSLAFRYEDVDNRFDSVIEIAANFVTDPTIGPLVKPAYGGITGDRNRLARQLVAHSPDRVVATWFSYGTHLDDALPPEQADHFQAVLSADSTARQPIRRGRARRADPS